MVTNLKPSPKVTSTLYPGPIITKPSFKVSLVPTFTTVAKPSPKVSHVHHCNQTFNLIPRPSDWISKTLTPNPHTLTFIVGEGGSQG